jgi:hypothetical protein
MSGFVAALAAETATLPAKKSKHTKFETMFIVPHFICQVGYFGPNEADQFC